MIKKVIIYALLAAIAYYVVSRMLTKGKYLKYLHSLGFGIADTMTFDEVRTSYIYLHDYARLYSTNASTMLQAANPALWSKAKAIADKYHIFNL